MSASFLRKAAIAYGGVLALALLAGLLVPAKEGLKASFGFSAWFGFASGLALIAAAWLAGLLFGRAPEADEGEGKR